MPSPFSHSPSPPAAGQSTNKVHATHHDADTALSHSLKQLSISASAASSPAKSPRSSRPAAPTPPTPYKPAVNRSPSSLSTRSAPRSPLNGNNTGSAMSNGRDARSRSSTPTLLRKASLNSLHSVSGVAPPRRASSVSIMSPSSAARSPLRSVSPEIPEKPPVTAASIASTFFRAELEIHHGASPNQSAETVVIVNDSCYGHRYSRPRTSRASLSTIVERPERIKAGVLGVSTAYVRLGERHVGGAYAVHPRLDPASIPIPFRIQKTARRLSLLSQAVANVHGTKWMEELKMMCESAEAKLALNGKELQRPDITRGPDQETPPKLHEGDLYLCAESLEALEGALGGVCDAVDAVFGPHGPKRAFVAIRPPGHHCSASYPSGFCWVNNVHVGIMHAILGHGLTHAAIIDFDLHHGDGSQAIAWQHNSRGVGLSKNAAWWKKTSIGYFSLHDINSYPCEMGDEEKIKNASLCIDNAHGQNIWNVHLQPWKSEAEFWKLYESKYSVLLEKTRSFLRGQSERLRAANQNSKAAIFLSAGFDASEWESSGMQRHNVNVPTEFYARLTRDVVRLAEEEGMGVDGRIISVLEGGYSDRALFSGILSHISGLAGEDPVPTKEEDYNGLGYEMGTRIGAVRERKDSSASKPSGRPMDPSWWAASEMERLESLMNVPPPAPKKPRDNTPPSYFSPTQASSAKVSAPRVRRSISGLSSLANGHRSRPPSPPPPEVPWTVAAHELSKLLIPIDRQTDSCTPEELSAEAARQRRDRQAVVVSQPVPPSNNGAVRMALRERKPAKPILPIDEEDDSKLGKNRRKTVAGPSVLSLEKNASRGSTPVRNGKEPTRQSRRLSIASTVVSESVEPTALLSTTNGVSRPESPQSIRPESSMSVRTTATTSGGAPLPVKKTRTANPVKKEVVPKAPKAQKKAAPGTKAGPSDAASTSTTPASSRPATAGELTGPARTENKPVDEMEQLTSGFKKIKINLITKAQREAREQAEKEKERMRKASPALPAEDIKVATPAVASPAVAAPVTFPRTPLNNIPMFDGTAEEPSADASALEEPSTISSRSSGPSTPVPTRLPALNPALTPAYLRQVPLPSSSPVLPGSAYGYGYARGAPPLPQASTPDMFVAYQPEGPAPSTLPQSQPLQWLPPNASTPTPMKRADLPVFSATGVIPFAARRGIVMGESAPAAAFSPAPTPGLQTQIQKPEAVVKSEDTGNAEGSVWQIPETPSN